VIFTAINLCVVSQRVFIVVHFVIDSVRKVLYTPSDVYMCMYVLMYVSTYLCIVYACMYLLCMYILCTCGTRRWALSTTRLPGLARRIV
jgi:hypothetical protein